MPLYGSQLWDYSHASINIFYVTWRKAIRKLLGLPFDTHSSMLHYICDDAPVNHQLFKRVVSLLNGLHTSKNELSQYCYRLAVSGSGSEFSNSCQ